MTIEETLQQLSKQQYPHQVDVVDRVMAEVGQKSYLQPVRRTVSWQRISAIAAAAVVALLAINIAVFNSTSYDDEGLGSMIAQVNDYSSWNTVEEYAVEPLEYLYEE